jgi:hypothetical protein
MTKKQKKQKKDRGPKKGSVLEYLEITLDQSINQFDPQTDLTVSEARSVLNDCPLDTVCGAYCRRCIDAATQFQIFTIQQLDYGARERIAILNVCVYTCVVTITG